MQHGSDGPLQVLTAMTIRHLASNMQHRSHFCTPAIATTVLLARARRLACEGQTEGIVLANTMCMSRIPNWAGK